MADKEIINLPAAPAFYDDAMILVYVPGSSEPAQRLTGAQLRAYAEAAAAHVQKGEKGDPGDVSSVCGVKADGDGNVPLTPAELGAVSNAGDTMTGDLTVSKTAPKIGLEHTVTGRLAYATATSDSRVYIRNELDEDNRSAILLNPESTSEAELLRIVTSVNGTKKDRNVLHTGNKPYGEYVGTGSATAQTVLTGATGNMAIICGNGKFVIVTAGGGYCSDGSSLAATSVKFTNGSLVISAASEYVNKSGVTYRYLVP